MTLDMTAGKPSRLLLKFAFPLMLSMLLQQCFLPSQRLAQMLADRVPLWKMSCTKDPEAAQVSFEAMSR